MNNTKFNVGDIVVIQAKATQYAVSENSIGKPATIISMFDKNNCCVKQGKHKWAVFSRDLKLYKEPYKQLLLFE